MEVLGTHFIAKGLLIRPKPILTTGVSYRGGGGLHVHTRLQLEAVFTSKVILPADSVTKSFFL